MKTNRIIGLFAVAMLSMSCRDIDPDPGGTVKICEWGKEESISFDKVELQIPGGMTQWFKGQFPTDNVIRDLWSVMYAKGDLNPSTTTANVSGSVVGGQGCTGTKTFEHKNDDPKITTKSVKAPFPNNGFIVEAEVTIRSDNFRNDGFSGGSAYYVLWKRRGKIEPGGALSGRISGSKMPFDPFSGKIFGKGYVISGGSKNYY